MWRRRVGLLCSCPFGIWRPRNWLGKVFGHSRIKVSLIFPFLAFASFLFNFQQGRLVSGELELPLGVNESGIGD